MKINTLLLSLLSTSLVFQSWVQAIPLPGAQATSYEEVQSFRFEGADIDTVMTQYCEWTGKNYLKTDQVQATITLKADRLTTAESIQVVEAILAMNNIALVPMGEKFIKVVQAGSSDLIAQGMQIETDPDLILANSDDFITTIIPLKNVQIEEVQAAVQHVLHSYGKILTLKRSNSIMITDTASNVNRARELIHFIDQATAQIEQRIYRIKHAEATEIAAKIDEIVDAAQGKDPLPAGANPYARTPAGVIRANTPPANAPQVAQIAKTQGSNAVLIQGDVKVLSDERTNIIIIFSQAENFPFFEKIIEVLDVTVEPETTFEVINLEYADAKELASTLNALIGNSSSSTRNSSQGSATSRSRNTQRNDTSNRNRTPVRANSAELSSSGINNLNRLSEETQILADERSNSILIMGEKSDISAIKEIIAKLDVKLEQVMIEVAIFEIELGESYTTGIEWLYSTTSGERRGGFPNNSTNNELFNTGFKDTFSYLENISGIDTTLAIELSANDSNTRLLQSPVIMTTDNTEAQLIIGEQRPVITGTSTLTTGNLRSSYEYKDIGLNLKITPRINPSRVVVLEISTQADQIGTSLIEIDGVNVPSVLNREFEAQISVPDGQTIALGGMIINDKDESAAKIPILGDIPLIGKYFFGSTDDSFKRTELIILLTPSVLTTDDELRTETQRRYQSMDMNAQDWPQNGWSESTLQSDEESQIDLKPLEQTHSPEELERLKALLQNR